MHLQLNSQNQTKDPKINTDTNQNQKPRFNPINNPTIKTNDESFLQELTKIFDLASGKIAFSYVFFFNFLPV